MDIQSALNISIFIVVIASVIQSIMRIKGLVKYQYAGDDAAAAHIGAMAAELIGLGIFLILMLIAADFMKEKINLLFGC